MDDADRASLDSEAYGEALAQRFTGEPYQIPPGEAGECQCCGEEKPRLIRGYCARCRDQKKLD